MKLSKKIWFLWLFLVVIIMFNFSDAAQRNLPWVRIISRSEWWADESIRLLKIKKASTSSAKKTEAQIKAANISKIRNAWMAKNFPNDWKYDETRTMSGNYYFIYPEHFNHNKTKIIIHHTAMEYNPNRTFSDIKAQLQKVYRYHTIDRHFGDIGYNFLIDQMWNIYEWRSGGEWAIWMHTANNNASSIWISLMWNFEKEIPTQQQLSALINLTTALSRFYNIDPYGKTYTFSINTSKEPYVVAKENSTIMWHKHVWNTACPGRNLEVFLPKLIDEVYFRLNNNIIWESDLPSSWISELSELRHSDGHHDHDHSHNHGHSHDHHDEYSHTTNTSKQNNRSAFSNRLISLKQEDPEIFAKAAQTKKNTYSWKLNRASWSISKITKKYTINEIRNLIKKDISVLLYELSSKYDSFEIKCDGTCIFTIDNVDYNRSNANLIFSSNKIHIKSDRDLIADSISVKSSISNGNVEISNYDRKSYAGISRNTFKGKLTFEKWEYPTLEGKQISSFIVINTLPFMEYMKWIVETNDTETLEKNKVMAMISKNYALFYLDKGNIHPSIDMNARYTAIDNPDFFQKYVWAWLEKTLTKRYQALNATENEIVMYNWYLPILPYFNCSAGFTLSAEEKRWWNDTSYLKSTFDFEHCNDFSGHWVWLAGKWAERFAKNWMKYDQILKYYYDWINIEKIN